MAFSGGTVTDMTEAEKKEYMKKYNDYFAFIRLNSEETTFVLEESDGSLDNEKTHILCQTTSLFLTKNDKTKVLKNILEEFIEKLEKVMPFFEKRGSVYFQQNQLNSAAQPNG